MLRPVSLWIAATMLVRRLLTRMRHGPNTLASSIDVLQLIGLVLLPLSNGRVGDCIAFVCRIANRLGLWQVTSLIVRLVLKSRLKSGTSEAISYQAMASPPWADEYYRGNSVELFFDATSIEYLRIISDRLLPIIEANARQGRAAACWFSIRFTGRSSAMLAMQQWERTVCIEVAALRGVPGSVQVLRELEAEAIGQGGRVHWGQQNDLRLEEVERMYPALRLWRSKLAIIAASDEEWFTFDNDYCRQRGLT